MTVVPPHPAKYTPAVLDVIVDLLKVYSPPPGFVLDPMAGTGRVHRLREHGYMTTGVELEAEWAAASPYTEQGDATDLSEHWGERFAAVVCSPPYGNRMADSYAGDARHSRRHTYRIALGRPLTEGSAGGMQWGDEYRVTMKKVLAEVRRVTMPGGIVVWNIKDHVRDGVFQRVPQWYEAQFELYGFEHVETVPVLVRGNLDGANAALRSDCELVQVYRKPCRSL